MGDNGNTDVRIERLENLSIVSLKVSRNRVDDARDGLQLALPLTVAGGDPRSLWVGPDHWLLVSNSKTPASIIGSCAEGLAGILHNAVDYSSALAVLRLSGPHARALLATGSGIDLRPQKFPDRTCCRTRLAQIAAIIVAGARDQIDVYVDRSYGKYLRDWLDHVPPLPGPMELC